MERGIGIAVATDNTNYLVRKENLPDGYESFAKGDVLHFTPDSKSGVESIIEYIPSDESHNLEYQRFKALFEEGKQALERKDYERAYASFEKTIELDKMANARPVLKYIVEQAEKTNNPELIDIGFSLAWIYDIDNYDERLIKLEFPLD